MSKKFALLMEKGNINGTLKLLTSNISKGILPLDDKTLSLLKQKHPALSMTELNEEVLLRGAGSNIKITTEGTRQLGALLGHISFKVERIRNEVQP